MANPLDTLLPNVSPVQRRVLVFGAGAVALLVIGRRMARPAPAAPIDDAPPEPPAAPGPSPDDLYGDGAVLGADALAGYQRQLADALADIRARLAATGNNAPQVPTANLRAETRARLWLYLYWLYGDAQPPAGAASPYTSDQIMAELRRRKVKKQNKHSASAAGRAYARYIDARDAGEASPAPAPAPVRMDNSEPVVTPARPAPPRVTPGRREPAPRPAPPREPARRPRPAAPAAVPVTVTPEETPRPAQVAAGAAAYGRTRRGRRGTGNG